MSICHAKTAGIGFVSYTAKAPQKGAGQKRCLTI